MRRIGLEHCATQQIITAAKKLQARGVKNVLVSLGERGSLFVQQDGTVITRPAFSVVRTCPSDRAITHVYDLQPKVVDTTGAGDTFRGDLAHCAIGHCSVPALQRPSLWRCSSAKRSPNVCDSLPRRERCAFKSKARCRACLRSKRRSPFWIRTRKR